MADSKITALTAITTVNPATYPLVIVDTSDTSMAITGTTKKVTTNQLLGSGGTATLASATITGDLTVDTSTLKVDSANNFVGVGTTTGVNLAAGRGNLTIGGSSSAILNLSIGATDTGYVIHDGTSIYLVNRIAAGSLIFSTNSTERLRIASDGVATWSNVGGVAGTAMTLNATGLGVGDAPTADCKLTVRGGAFINRGAAGGASQLLVSLAASSGGNFGQISNTGTRWALGYGPTLTTVGTEALIWDAAGNVGIGVQPSAWTTSYNALNIGSGGSIAAYKSANYDQLYVGSNFFENTSGAWRFINDGYATQYWHNSGSHVWRISTTSNAAGANQPLTWTSAMTLTAVGELLVGTTSVGGVFDTKFYLSSNSGTNKWAVGPYGTATNFAIIPTPGTGGVYLSGTSATSWTAYSDERLKDIIEPITNALAKVGSLRSVIGKFKGDEANTRRPFLIAQDLQSALPEAVDASNPDRLGVAYTDVIPLLVAAIKELTAEVNALKNA